MSSRFLSVCSSLAYVLAFAPACSSDGGATAGTAASFEDQLAEASSSQVIKLGPGTFQGPFTIPAGVTVEGAGMGTTIIVGPSDGAPPIRITPGTDTATALSGLTVQSASRIGITGSGSGMVALTDVSVEATLGVGVGFEDLTAVSMSNVSIVGPVDEPTAASLPAQPTIEQIATHGLVFINVAAADLSDVTSEGFANFGVLSLSSNLTWTGGNASRNLGSGVMVHGGTADLSAVEICGTLQGVRLIPAY